MVKTNFHTHTVYCDGKNTPEELTDKALELGFTSLGFSGHSYFERDKASSMSPEREDRYFDEITSLKERYAARIELFCGIEQDIFSKTPEKPYDYIIGSVHNVLKNGEYLIVDGSRDECESIVRKHYGGSFDDFARDYFETVSGVVEKTNADIIGHFDLILKNMERIGYTPTPTFYKYAKEAARELLRHKVPFEINTGAVARGYRSEPYPDLELLRFIYDNGGSIIVSSDCHRKELLDFGLEEAKKMAKEVGFTKQAVVTREGVRYVAL